MARSGWTTSDYLRHGAGVAIAAPFSVAAWGYTTSLAVNQVMIGFFNSGAVSNRNLFRLLANSSGTIDFAAADGAGQRTASTSTTLTTDHWFHACGVAAADDNRAVYLNGGGKGTNTNSRIPAGIDETVVGRNGGADTNLPFGSTGTGYLAEVAVWNLALTDAEVAVLAKAISPLKMRPEALIAYWPLIGRNTPETNLRSNAAVLAATGSPIRAPHPRILRPRGARERV